MKVRVEKPKSWQRVLEIEVPANRVAEEFNAAYTKYRRKATIPGFRRGRVPTSILRARFGSSIDQEVLESLVPKAYQEAVEKEELSPIEPPKVSAVEFKPGEPLRFKASVEVKPEIDVGEYRRLEVTKKIRKVSDDDLTAALENLREQHARFYPVERPSKPGDYLVIDCLREDQAGGREQSSGLLVEVGSGNMLEDLDRELQGVKPGEERNVLATIPPDYSDRKLAGQKVRFQVKVREVKEKRLPPLNDDFAKEAGEYQNLDHLKEALMGLLTEKIDAEERRRLKKEIVNQLIEKTPFEVPESMVTNYLNAVVKTIRSEHGEEINEDEVKNRYRESAIWHIKRTLILEEIGRREQIEVTDGEIQEIKRQLTHSQPPRATKANFFVDERLNKIKEELKEKKVLDFLLDHAEVKVQKDEK